MPKSSLKLFVASFFTLLALAFSANAPFASASPTTTNTSNYSSDDDYSNDDEHSDDDECEDDDSKEEDSSKLNKNLSKKSSKSSKSDDKNRKNDDKNKKNDDDDDDESCGGGNGGGGNGGGGNGGGGNGGGVGTLVPLTLATPAISSCTTSAELSWVAIVSPGYAAVDIYEVRYSSDNGVTWTAYATQTAATTLTLTGLTAGTTYLFQVAAHNVNGWGAWSASTTGCTITSPVPTTARFTFSGSDTFIFDYQDPTGPVRTVVFGGTGLGSGDVATGVYAYDLYISVPIGTYTVTVNGVPFLGSAFSASSVVGSNKPASFSDPLMMGDYSFLQTYGFTITPGSVIAIVIV